MSVILIIYSAVVCLFSKNHLKCIFMSLGILFLLTMKENVNSYITSCRMTESSPIMMKCAISEALTLLQIPVELCRIERNCVECKESDFGSHNKTHCQGKNDDWNTFQIAGRRRITKNVKDVILSILKYDRYNETSKLRKRRQLDSGQSIKSTGLLPDVCGQKPLQGYIYDGKTGWIPWQVAIFQNTDWSTYYCTGSLLNKYWIISAAHCFINYKGKLDDNFNAVVKIGNRQINEQYAQLKQINFRNVFPHPNYAQDTFDNDIALIKLDSPVILGGNVSTVCLPNLDEPMDIQDLGEISGWGWTQNSKNISNDLQVAQVKIDESANCKVNDKPLTDNMLCVQPPSGNNRTQACRGDNGGPLSFKEHKGWTIEGIISNGEPNCMDPKTVYTKVRNYVSWINKMMSKL